jgi:hypothetical protein
VGGGAISILTVKWRERRAPERFSGESRRLKNAGEVCGALPRRRYAERADATRAGLKASVRGRGEVWKVATETFFVQENLSPHFVLAGGIRLLINLLLCFLLLLSRVI